MDKFFVEGGHPLSGTLTPSGNKNEALPVLAATLLTDQTVRLRNVPEILDIAIMRELIASLGASVSAQGDHTFEFQARNILGHAPEFTKATRIRGSFLLAGPMLARFGEVSLPVPGGDRIGLRPVQTHLLALEELGAQIRLEGGIYRMQTDGLKGTCIQLDEASVMATENAVMAAVLAEGQTEIYNAACEPHVQGLCRLLVQMGAKMEGIGSNRLQIQGVSSLQGADYAVQPDHIEVGSFIGLAAVTRGEIRICNAGVEHLRMVRLMFDRLGVTTKVEGDDLLVPGDQELVVRPDTPGGIPKIDDGPWPAFPADLTSIMTVTATQSRGAVLIFEKMFESRLFWVDKLISMGAQIILCDPHRAVVSGPAALHGAEVSSPDIRAGMSLLIAALGAKGTTEIHNVSQIDRGYERIEERLSTIGARIRRVKE
jgi:UDP-N-acetylglucosamine 1-carboxyvinyltransferase